MKVFTDTSGCCPTSKLVCDKSLCPPKLKKCEKEFYELVKIDGVKDECCEQLKCIPPKNKCIVEIDGKKVLKTFGDKWVTKDPCITKMCAFGADDLPYVKETKEQCTNACETVC